MTTTEITVKAGQVFEAKKPKAVGLFGYYDDREILYVSSMKVLTKLKTINPKFVEWCKQSSFRYTTSELSMIDFENETGENARFNVWDFMVQYDSPCVKMGRNYPQITMQTFLAWAGREITTEIPTEGKWRMKEYKTKAQLT